ncbi:MAG TPA: hypothetical protein VE973_00550, partial [Candidatus Limnocylindria bacterium]|nr:hypothetical protein [Candidatus Limnocylindria bacterium]
MDEIESQIAKIQLGNNKSSNSYVYTMAEKADGDDSELYVVAELPLFNPAAQEDCERICLAIASTLKRSFRKASNSATFETAISQINEELGKLASMGQTQWIDKLSCILGVKKGKDFNIASCGKVSAYLLRNGEFTDISCSPEQSHPLKTFENYASGKIRLGDLILLSTTQLFNHLSMDRLLTIMDNGDFLAATRTIIQLLKDNAEPQISFGVLLNMQVPAGKVNDSDIDLENYIVETPSSRQSIFGRAFTYAKTAFAMKKNTGRVPKVDLPKTLPASALESEIPTAENKAADAKPALQKISEGLKNVSPAQTLKNFSSTYKNAVGKSRNLWENTKIYAGAAKDAVRAKTLKNLSGQKKFFAISLAVLLLALIFSIFVAIHTKNTQQAESKITAQLKTAQDLVSNAQASLLYKDFPAAAKYLSQVKDSLPPLAGLNSADKATYNKILAEYDAEILQSEKNVSVDATNLGNIGQGGNLIALPQYDATQADKIIISYNKQSGKIEDAVLNSPVDIIGSVYIGGSSAAIYDGTSLYVWDFSTGKLSSAFSQNVPSKDDFGGMSFYDTNKRVYLVDKKSNTIISYAAGKSGLAKPVVSVRDSSLN